MQLTPRLALALTLPPLLWAGNAVIGRLAVGMAPPLALNALRWLLALALLLPLGWQAFRGPEQRARLRRRLPSLLWLSLTGVGAYNALQYAALTTSTPLNVTLIAASSPVWMMALGALFYGVRPQPRQMLSAVLSLAGVAVVLSRGRLGALGELQLVPGDLLMLLAILSWAVYSWQLARPPHAMTEPDGQPAWTWSEFLCVQMVVGLVWTGSSAGLEAALTPDAGSHWHFSWALVAVLAYVAIGPSIVAYRLWGLGVAGAGPAVAAFFGNLTPLFAALLSAAMLGEWPQAYHALAFALIVAGIVVATPRRAA